MAGDLLHYSGLLTKTRAMSGKLLTEEEINRLTELATVTEAILFLKGKAGYGDVYREQDTEWHREQAEELIISSLYRDLKKLYQFSNSIQRKALDIIILRYEADILKYYLKSVYQKSVGPMESTGSMESYLDDFFKKHIRYPMEPLIRAGNILEFRQALKNTPYERIFMQMGQGKDSFGDYAQKIDIHNYMTAYKAAQKFEQPAVKHVLSTVLGTRIDWLNIMWIYRAKRFYRQTPADIHASLIPVSYRLKKEEEDKMIRAQDIQEMVKVLSGTSYFKGEGALVQMEDEISYYKVIGKMYQEVNRKHPVSMAPVLKYIFDKEQEIEMVTTIIEGIRYQVSPKEIRDLILITI